MNYNQGRPCDSSRPQPSYYGPYSYSYSYPHHYAPSSASSSYHQPPPPGTEHTDPAAASSSSSAAEASRYAAGGMNPAAASAVAALTQLTDFAASMGSSERAMGHQVYPPHYPPAHHPAAVGGKGTLMGGRRGGGPSRGRGRGRGSSTHHPLIHGVTSLRGRGQGRGRSRGGMVGGRQLIIPAPAAAAESQPGTAPALAHIQDVGQATTANITRVHVLPVAWCDICRVECNSKEILEQHKNGKRHKRTVQRMQVMAGLQGITPAIFDTVTPASQVGGLPEASSELVEGRGSYTALHMAPPAGSSSYGGEEHKNLASENAIASVSGVQVSKATTGISAQQNTPTLLAVGHSVEPPVELRGAAVQAHQPVDEMKEGSEAAPSNAPPNVQLSGARLDGNISGNGSKRKTTRSNRGGKRPRTSEAPRRRPERVREQPLVCTICNVTCDTRAVFDIHLGGKKHLSRLKRSQGAGTVFSPSAAYIPPNQPVTYSVGAPELVFDGLKSRGMVPPMQHAFRVLPQMTSEATYAVEPMAGPMRCTLEAGTEQVGNVGSSLDATSVEASSQQVGNGGSPLSAAAVEADAKAGRPPC